MAFGQPLPPNDRHNVTISLECRHTFARPTAAAEQRLRDQLLPGQCVLTTVASLSDSCTFSHKDGVNLA
jgi:hypothetical protein